MEPLGWMVDGWWKHGVMVGRDDCGQEENLDEQVCFKGFDKYYGKMTECLVFITTSLAFVGGSIFTHEIIISVYFCSTNVYRIEIITN